MNVDLSFPLLTKAHSSNFACSFECMTDIITHRPYHIVILFYNCNCTNGNLMDVTKKIRGITGLENYHP